MPLQLVCWLYNWISLAVQLSDLLLYVCTVVLSVQLSCLYSYLVCTVVHLYRRQSVQMADRKDNCTDWKLYRQMAVPMDNCTKKLPTLNEQTDNCTGIHLYRLHTVKNGWQYRQKAVQIDNCSEGQLYWLTIVQRDDSTNGWLYKWMNTLYVL